MSEPANKIICNICDKEFKFQYLLENHKNSKRKCKPIDEKIKCQDCNILYFNKYTFAKHKCKAKQEDIIMLKTIIENLLEHLKQDNIDNESLITLQNLIPKIVNNDSNNTTNNTTNNDINNSNTTNTTHSHNTNNTNTNNNDSHDNINLTQNFIFPFGLEDGSFLSDEESLKILKITKNIIPIIKKIYSENHNCNFIKNNANKDVITVLNSDMNLETYRSSKFYKKLIDNAITFLECLFYKHQPQLKFDHQMAVLLNIEDLRSIYLGNQDLLDISACLDSKFQNSLTKFVFKKYFDSLLWNETIKAKGIHQARELKSKISKIYSDFNNSTITDLSLQHDIWSRAFNCPETDPEARYNDLLIYRFESTRRYKFIRDRQEEEFHYFREHGISIGNLCFYRQILLDRKKREIDTLENNYADITTEIKNRIMSNIMDVMVNDTFNKLLDEIKNMKFIIDESNTILDDTDNANNTEDFLDDEIEVFSAMHVDMDSIENVDVDIATVDTPQERGKSNIEDKNVQHTLEELLAQGYVLDTDGDYVKKIPKWKLNRKNIMV